MAVPYDYVGATKDEISHRVDAFFESLRPMMNTVVERELERMVRQIIDERIHAVLGEALIGAIKVMLKEQCDAALRKTELLG